jgi:serine/threonine-protein kinase
MLYDAIATGGMASVHLGRMMGQAGFARTVAIKRLHPHLARDPDFVTMFLDEARLAARVHHPNVVPTLDIVSADGELLLVMEYVRGESLSRLLAASRACGEAPNLPALASLVVGTLNGLDAAHEAKSESGEPLFIVHRDVSPQNVLVGADGVARLVDFGVAKAASRAHSTEDGKLKGKLSYMAPEQVRRAPVDRRADIYAVGVILWEALARRRLFTADDPAGILHAVLHAEIPSIASVVPSVPSRLADVVHNALARDPEDRFDTALEMAEALEAAVSPAPARKVSAWVKAVAAPELEAKDAMLASVEASSPSQRAAAPTIPEAVVRFTEQPTDLEATKSGSQITAVSVATDVVSKRRGRWPWLAGAAAMVVSATLATWAVVHGRASASSGEVRAGSAPPALASGQDDMPSGSASSDPPSSSSPTPVASATPSPIARPDTPASTSPAARPARAKRASPTGNPKRDCVPPYTVDSNGIEHFKPWCL